MKTSQHSPYTESDKITSIYVGVFFGKVVVTFNFYNGAFVVKTYSHNAWRSIKTCGIIPRGVPIYY